MLDENGKLVTVTMGSYGIGVSRAVAAVAESTPDDTAVWPRDIAPADVHLVATGKDEAVFAAAEPIAADLDAAGSRCSTTTGGGRPGVKFTDAELLGMPTIVVVGRRLADGLVEVRTAAPASVRTSRPTTWSTTWCGWSGPDPKGPGTSPSDESTRREGHH